MNRTYIVDFIQGFLDAKGAQIISVHRRHLETRCAELFPPVATDQLTNCTILQSAGF